MTDKIFHIRTRRDGAKNWTVFQKEYIYLTKAVSKLQDFAKHDESEFDIIGKDGRSVIHGCCDEPKVEAPEIVKERTKGEME